LLAYHFEENQTDPIIKWYITVRWSVIIYAKNKL
jgi:hypothetical protein